MNVYHFLITVACALIGHSTDHSYAVISSLEVEEIKLVELTEAQKFQLASTFEKVYSIEENKLIIDYLSDVNANIGFAMYPEMKSPGAYDRKKKLIYFRESNSINYHVLVEEFFHAYQDQVIGIGNHRYDQAFVNIEFEAKLYADIIQMKYTEYLVGELGLPIQILGSSSESYINWLKSATNNFSKAPDWPFMQRRYYHFLEEFSAEKTAYGKDIDYKDQPLSLFSVFNPDELIKSRR
ncbi:MAG: hypothetical protein AAFQ94_10060 [Bacteroidota bacterium]